MKIERLSDNQIRCTLTKSDLQERQLKLSELAFGSEKAKNLFHDMIEQASVEFGFEAEDLPLMIEAIPTSLDTIILVITKVSDPAEFEEKISHFSPCDESEEYTDEDYDDDYSDEPILDEGEIEVDFTDFFNEALSQAGKTDSDIINSAMKDDTDFIDAVNNYNQDKASSDFIPMSETIGKKNADKPVEPKPIEIIFSFEGWDLCAKAARNIGANCQFPSTLYLREDTNTYYLLVSGTATPEFTRIENKLREYGRKERSNYASKAYFAEHCRTIARDNAIQILIEY